MGIEVVKWSTQIKKGYYELCILLLLKKDKLLTGVDILNKLNELGIKISDGTIYPLLKRLVSEKIIQANWEVDDDPNKRPKKYYKITEEGEFLVEFMQREFSKMGENLNALKE